MLRWISGGLKFKMVEARMRCCVVALGVTLFRFVKWLPGFETYFFMYPLSNDVTRYDCVIKLFVRLNAITLTFL
jgi:hypothetical protein